MLCLKLDWLRYDKRRGVDATRLSPHMSNQTEGGDPESHYGVASKLMTGLQTSPALRETQGLVYTECGTHGLRSSSDP